MQTCDTVILDSIIAKTTIRENTHYINCMVNYIDVARTNQELLQEVRIIISCYVVACIN